MAACSQQVAEPSLGLLTNRSVNGDKGGGLLTNRSVNGDKGGGDEVTDQLNRAGPQVLTSTKEPQSAPLATTTC